MVAASGDLRQCKGQSWVLRQGLHCTCIYIGLYSVVVQQAQSVSVACSRSMCCALSMLIGVYGV